MKKSLLALAVLGAFAGAASAQSTVTLYGRVDLSLNKPIGTENKGVANGSGSRLGVRGVEDLGGGLKALFNIEHRFDADTGQITSSNGRFWSARSIVGLEGGFGRFWMGREYTPVFLSGKLLSDPWGYDTVAAQAYLSAVPGSPLPGDLVRRDNTVNFQFTAAGFTGWFQLGEADGQGPDRPWGGVLSYGAGPLYLALAYDNPAGADDKFTWLTANYDFGAFKLWSGFGRGDRQVGPVTVDADAWTIGATAPVGGGEFRAAIGRQEVNDVKTVSYLGLGYHYALSKRTTLYFDYARNGELDDEKHGYDIGVKHNF